MAEDARCAGRIARGALRYARTGTTPDDAYHSLIWLHCRINGRSTDLLHRLARRSARPVPLPAAEGVLGALGPRDVADVVARIREQGYARFPKRLSPKRTRRLMEFALRTEAQTSPPRPDGPIRAVYQPDHPVAEAYKFDEATLIAEPEIQSLMADLSLISIAQAYLRCLPVLSIVTMWWSTSARYSAAAKAELAQMYHFDMDHVKWLKFFFYLTDVTPETGPHCFIGRSHRAGNQPRALLRRGYVRLRDDELEPHYPAADRVEISGPAGTIFAADTRGFHKGITPRSGHRLMLQLEFCDSLFGGTYARPPFPAECVPELAQRREALARLYSRYS